MGPCIYSKQQIKTLASMPACMFAVNWFALYQSKLFGMVLLTFGFNHVVTFGLYLIYLYMFSYHFCKQSVARVAQPSKLLIFLCSVMPPIPIRIL